MQIMEGVLIRDEHNYLAVRDKRNRIGFRKYYLFNPPTVYRTLINSDFGSYPIKIH